MKKLLIWMMFLLPVTAWAQSAAVKQIMKMAKEDNRTMEHLDILCNRFGGRLAGSYACETAEKWAKKCFEEWGYDVKLDKIGDMSVGFSRGGWWGRATGDENMVLHFVTPAFTSGTKGPQSGHVVLEPLSHTELERNRARLKGAWVLIECPTESGFALPRGDSKRFVDKRDAILKQNDEIAEKQGKRPDRSEMNKEMPALLYDEMVEAGVLGFIRSTPVPLNALHDTLVIRRNHTFDMIPSVPDILLDEEQFARLHKAASERRKVTLEFDIRNYFRPGPIPYHNVVASIKGSKYPDEYVILSAHLDAYDISSGGVDCGNGVAAVMEAARMLSVAKAKPERAIIFILFGGEEFGLRGSKAWIEAHKDKLDKVSIVFNRDGGPLPYVGFDVPKSLVKEYEAVAEPIRQVYPEYDFKIGVAEPMERPEKPRTADHYTFRYWGIPAATMTMKDIKGYGFSYREIRHTERDSYQSVYPDYEEQSAPILAIIALGSANLSKMVPREEFYEPKK